MGGGGEPRLLFSYPGGAVATARFMYTSSVESLSFAFKRETANARQRKKVNRRQGVIVIIDYLKLYCITKIKT